MKTHILIYMRPHTVTPGVKYTLTSPTFKFLTVPNPSNPSAHSHARSKSISVTNPYNNYEPYTKSKAKSKCGAGSAFEISLCTYDTGSVGSHK